MTTRSLIAVLIASAIVVSSQDYNVKWLDERDGLVFRLDDLSKLQQVPIETLDEHFEMDRNLALKRLAQLKKLANKDDFLETSKLREQRIRREEYLRNRIRRGVLRLIFQADGIAIQGVFGDNDTGHDLMDFVRQHLADKDLEFSMYTSPPRHVIDADQRLRGSGLFPASRVYFGSEAKGKVLNENIESMVTDVEHMDMATNALRERLNPHLFLTTEAPAPVTTMKPGKKVLTAEERARRKKIMMDKMMRGKGGVGK